MQMGQKRLANGPFGGAVGTEIGGENGVGGAFDEHGALGLRITRVAGATAGIAERLDVVRLVRYFQITAVNGDQPEPGVKRVGMSLGLGKRHAGFVHQALQWLVANLGAHLADRGFGDGGLGTIAIGVALHP